VEIQGLHGLVSVIVTICEPKKIQPFLNNAPSKKLTMFFSIIAIIIVQVNDKLY
jgi:hypothetical protein